MCERLGSLLVDAGGGGRGVIGGRTRGGICHEYNNQPFAAKNVITNPTTSE